MRFVEEEVKEKLSGNLDGSQSVLLADRILIPKARFWELRLVILSRWWWRRRPTVRPLHLDDIPTCGNIGSGITNAAWFGLRCRWRRWWCGRLLITHCVNLLFSRT